MVGKCANYGKHHSQYKKLIESAVDSYHFQTLAAAKKCPPKRIIQAFKKSLPKTGKAFYKVMIQAKPAFSVIQILQSVWLQNLFLLAFLQDKFLRKDHWFVFDQYL